MLCVLAHTVRTHSLLGRRKVIVYEEKLAMNTTELLLVSSKHLNNNCAIPLYAPTRSGNANVIENRRSQLTSAQNNRHFPPPQDSPFHVPTQLLPHLSPH